MKRRLVLKTPASRDALLRHFYQRSWNYIREHQPTEGDPRPHQIAWTRGAKREHRVDWFDDRAVDLQFFEISTDTPEHLALIENERIRSGPFDIYTDEELRQDYDAARTPAEKIAAFTRLAVGAPERAEPWLLTQAERMLSDADPSVRREALIAAVHMGWPELRPAFTKIANEDSDAKNQELAQLTLQEYDRLDI